MNDVTVHSGKVEVKREAGGTDAGRVVNNGILARAANRLTEAGFQSAHYDVDILVPVGIKIRDREQVLK